MNALIQCDSIELDGLQLYSQLTPDCFIDLNMMVLVEKLSDVLSNRGMASGAPWFCITFSK